LLKHVFKSLLQFELVKWFGAIPKKGIRSWNEKAIPRSAVADVYASIQNDLIYASKFISIAAQRESHQWRCTLLGKVFVR
jgi:hypothetical protein